jgi:hypothetical protein
MWLCKYTFQITSNVKFIKNKLYKSIPRELTYHFKWIDLVELRKIKLNK